MPPPLLRTHMIKLILQNVLSQGQSQRRCAQALGISKGVVAKYVAAAQAAGLGWSAIPSRPCNFLLRPVCAVQPCTNNRFTLDLHKG